MCWQIPKCAGRFLNVLADSQTSRVTLKSGNGKECWMEAWLYDVLMLLQCTKATLMFMHDRKSYLFAPWLQLECKCMSWQWLMANEFLPEPALSRWWLTIIQTKIDLLLETCACSYGHIALKLVQCTHVDGYYVGTCSYHLCQCKAHGSLLRAFFLSWLGLPHMVSYYLQAQDSCNNISLGLDQFDESRKERRYWIQVTRVSQQYHGKSCPIHAQSSPIWQRHSAKPGMKSQWRAMTAPPYSWNIVWSAT